MPRLPATKTTDLGCHYSLFAYFTAGFPEFLAARPVAAWVSPQTSLSDKECTNVIFSADCGENRAVCNARLFQVYHLKFHVTDWRYTYSAV